MKKSISVSLLLSLSYVYLIYITSPEWSKLFGFSDSMYLLKKELIYLVIGLSIVTLFLKFKSEVLFNRIGAVIFVISGLMLLSMFFVSSSIVPAVDAKILYLVIVGVSIYPMLFFTFGLIWFIDYLHNSLSIKNLNLSIVGLMLFSGFITLSFHDYGFFLLLEILLIFSLFYIKGISKYLVGSIIGVLLATTAFILTSPHRLSRLQSWFASTDVAAIKNPLDMSSLSLVMHQLGADVLIFVIMLFLLLIYFVKKEIFISAKHKLFAIGILATFVISLGLNLLSVLGLLPVSPPSLYFFTYGLSITIVSFVMITMLGV